MAQAWLRLFTVQASWNHDRLQGVGVAYASEPLLRDLPGGPDDARYREALARAAQYFNAHPYLIGLAVGAIARAEHEGVPPEQIERLKTALPGPLGAVGDRLVWAGVLPAASGVGLTCAATLPWAVGPVVFLALYNLAHLVLRTWALASGWITGMQVARAISQPWLRRSLASLAPLAALTVGFALPIMGQWLAESMSPLEQAGVGGVAFAGLVLGRWIAPSVSGLKYGLATVSVALLVGWLWR